MDDAKTLDEWLLLANTQSVFDPVVSRSRMVDRNTMEGSIGYVPRVPRAADSLLRVASNTRDPARWFCEVAWRDGHAFRLARRLVSRDTPFNMFFDPDNSEMLEAGLVLCALDTERATAALAVLRAFGTTHREDVAIGIARFVAVHREPPSRRAAIKHAREWFVEDAEGRRQTQVMERERERERERHRWSAHS